MALLSYTIGSLEDDEIMYPRGCHTAEQQSTSSPL